MEEINKYYCIHCKKTIDRKSNKQWIKSICMEKGIRTHILKQ